MIWLVTDDRDLYTNFTLCQLYTCECSPNYCQNMWTGTFNEVRNVSNLHSVLQNYSGWAGPSTKFHNILQNRRSHEPSIVVLAAVFSMTILLTKLSATPIQNPVSNLNIVHSIEDVPLFKVGDLQTLKHLFSKHCRISNDAGIGIWCHRLWLTNTYDDQDRNPRA